MLLSAWGVEYQDDKVLADNELALRVRMSQNERPMPHLGMVGVPRENFDQEDIITSRLETVNFASAGALSQSDDATTTFEPLIRSSSDAMLMDAALVENMTDPSILFDEFQSQGTSYVLTARVSGEITSAFQKADLRFQRTRPLVIRRTQKFHRLYQASLPPITRRLLKAMLLRSLKRSQQKFIWRALRARRILSCFQILIS